MAKITKAKLIQLQKRLKTDDKIGKQYGITRQAIHQIRKKYGIDSVLAKNAERNEKIVKAYKAGKTGTVLAKKFKLSISQTYRIINEGKRGKKKVKKAARKKTNPKAIGTWPTPEKPKRKVLRKKVTKKKVVRKKVKRKKTNPRAIDTVPLPEKPKSKKKKVVKKKVVKKAKKKVVKKKKK